MQASLAKMMIISRERKLDDPTNLRSPCSGHRHHTFTMKSWHSIKERRTHDDAFALDSAD